MLRPGDAGASAAFSRDGFARLPGWLDENELGSIRREVDRVLAQPLPPGCDRPHNSLAPLRWNDLVVERVLGSVRRVRVLEEALAAEDLRWISGYVSVKAPHSEVLWWHQDWWCWDHPVTYRFGAVQVALLCYLSDTSEDNGALRVLPGSHRDSVPLHAVLPEAHANEAGDLTPSHDAMKDSPGQVTVTARAGDAVVVDYRLLHGTHPNTSAQRRDCVMLTFAPDWRRLPTEIRAHLIRHPAQPPRPEAATSVWSRRLLPRFYGRPRDLPLTRVAPSHFEIRGSASAPPR